MMKSYQNKTKWQISQTIKKSCLMLLILCGISVSGIAHATNHWSVPSDIHSVSPREEGVFVFVTGVPVINPGGCDNANGYVIARDNPMFDDLYKTALTALATGLKFRAIVSDEPERCIRGKPMIVFTSISPI